MRGEMEQACHVKFSQNFLQKINNNLQLIVQL